MEQPRGRPLIIGHRGAAGHAPENTPASFAAAVALGVDAVEFDVQFTADGYPVVFHDETLQRMAGVPVRIRDCTESVLRCFDVGFLHGAEHRGQRIPPVGQVAEMVPAGVELHVEIKDYDQIGEDHLRRLMETLRAGGALGRATFSSPHEETLAAIRKISPGSPTALLIFRSIKVPTDAARRAAYIGCAAVCPNHALVDDDLVSVCHRHGMRVFPFTVNERGTMRKLVRAGVDGFYTDYPDRFQEEAP